MQSTSLPEQVDSSASTSSDAWHGATGPADLARPVNTTGNTIKHKTTKPKLVGLFYTRKIALQVVFKHNLADISLLEAESSDPIK